MSVGPWPDLYLNFYPFTCIMDPAHIWPAWLGSLTNKLVLPPALARDKLV